MLNILSVYNPLDGTEFFTDVINKSDVTRDVIYVVVPEQYAYETELNLVNRLSCKGLFNVEVFGIKKLIRKLSMEARIDTSSTFTELGKKIVLKSLLKSNNNKLRFYKNAYSSEDFLDIVMKNLDLLRQDMVGVDQLNSYADSLYQENRRLSDKLSELAFIYSLYLEHLSVSNPDEFVIIEQLIEHYSRQKEEKYTLIVDGFSGMSSLEISLLAALSSASRNDAYLRVLKNKADSAVNSYVERFVDEVKTSFTDFSVPYREMSSDVPQSNSAAFFAGNFSINPTAYRGGISIYSLKSIEEEIKKIVVFILDKMRSENLSFGDFAVLGEKVEEHSSLISRIFDLAGIPYFVDDKKSISSHYFVEFISASFDCINKNFDKDDVLAVLKAYAMFHRDKYQHDINVLVSEINNHIVRKNIDRNRFFKSSKWEKVFESDLEKLASKSSKTDVNYKEKELLYSEILDLKHSLLDPLLALADSLKEDVLVEAKIAYIKKYLEDIGLFDALDRALNTVEDEESEKYLSSIEKKITDTFEQVSNIASASEFSSEELLNMISFGISDFSVGHTPPSEETVKLGSISRSMYSSVKYLLFPFANEGVFPKKVSNASLIFSDKELEDIENLGYRSVKSADKFYDKELYDVFEKISKTEKQVVFTYSQSDEAGKEILPSAFVNMLIKNGALHEVTEEVSLSDIVRTGSNRLVFETVFKSYRDIVGREELLSVFEKNDYGQELSLYNKAKTDYEYKPIVEAEDKSSYELSVTKLDYQAKCPFSYFVRYILNPSDLKKEDVGHIEVGNLFHDVLFEYVKRYKVAEDKEQYLMDIEDHLTDIYLEKSQKIEEFSYDKENLFRREVLPISLRLAAENIAIQLSPSEDAKLRVVPERSYSYDYKVDGKDVRLSGKIDRLDIYSDEYYDYVRVVDYKSGLSLYNETEVFAGVSSQLPTYLEMGLKMDIKTGKVDDKAEINRAPMGMFYQTLKNCNVHESDFSPSYRDEKISSYRLDGRFINDTRIMKLSSQSLNEENKAVEMKARIDRYGNFAKNSQSIALEDFAGIIERNKENRERLSLEIISKSHDISPCRVKEFIPCNICDYKFVCRFNRFANSDKIRYVKPVKKSDEEE